MIGILIPIITLVGSVSLMATAVIKNQLDPDYASALAIPFVNFASLVVALLGTGIAALVYLKRKDSRTLKYTMVVGAVLSIALMVMFPFSDAGQLSRFR